MFLFLPVTAFGYFQWVKHSPKAAQIWLALASLIFYGYWNSLYVPLIVGSALFNYLLGKKIAQNKSKPLLVFGIITNLGTLAYFKYADFLAENILDLFSTAHEGWGIVLPLAISFFTFQQIAYLVDAYKNEAKDYDFFHYMLFVFFFPQLIAGPIVHHAEMMPQFSDAKNKAPSFNHVAAGIVLFTVGFIKKVVLADTFAIWANDGFNNTEALTFLEGWGTSLSYTLQLYFDFSGYCDMAIASALFFSIKLPFNFNSPYKANSIQDFWRRWHITLSRFLRDYIYIPLGGNQKKHVATSLNVLITFLLGGIWHGAAWTFLLWGGVHGLALIIQRLWANTKIVLPHVIGVLITFLFVNFAWVLFRAENIEATLNIWQAMLNWQDIAAVNALWAAAILGGLAIVFFAPNSNGLRDTVIKHPRLSVFLSSGFLFTAIIIFEVRQTSEFLYFQF